jgi:sterol 3beta-glucosyltransferase
MAADQPSWGKQVQALGIGPAPLPFKKLTATQLAEAIREAVTNTTMRKQATELEDGPGRTINIFSQYVEKFRYRKWSEPK